MSRTHDQLHRFAFENFAVRGGLVRLRDSWQSILDNHTYPKPVADQLGQGLAAATLLSTNIKMDGQLILQAQGSGPLTTLVAQASDKGLVRALAQYQGTVPAGDIKDTFGNGRLVITIDAEGSKRYQGIVDLQGGNLAQAIEYYFQRSEQIVTRLWLFANHTYAGGLLLQKLPTGKTSEDDWHRLGLMVDTLSPKELFELPAGELLHRLFSEDDVRLFKAKNVAFHCTCGRDRIASTIRALGKQEAVEILESEGQITATCEFCNKTYVFDSVDVAGFFQPVSSYDAGTRH